MTPVRSGGAPGDMRQGRRGLESSQHSSLEEQTWDTGAVGKGTGPDGPALVQQRQVSPSDGNDFEGTGGHSEFLNRKVGPEQGHSAPRLAKEPDTYASWRLLALRQTSDGVAEWSWVGARSRGRLTQP